MTSFVGDLNFDSGFNQNKNAQLAFDIATAPTPLPEPATLTLLDLGLLGSATTCRRSTKRNG